MADHDHRVAHAAPDDAGVTVEPDDSDQDDLQRGLLGLAGMVSGAMAVEGLLAQVAQFATDAIPGVGGAGVTLLSGASGPPQVQAWAATADVVRAIDRIQYQLVNEGPCLTCMGVQRPVLSGSLSRDVRWPRFGARVARLGIRSALSLPLLVQGRVIGAINSYARDRDAFTDHAVRLGERFAGPAAVAVHNAQLLSAAQAKAEQLQAALTNRAIIDQAIGILRSRIGASADEAFQRLRRISQSENVKLSIVAERLVDESVRRAHARP